MGLIRRLLVTIPHGTLIDIETTAIEPDDGELICLGHVSGNSLTIVNRATESAGRFCRRLRGIVRGLPRPFYAYNRAFEAKWIEAKLCVRVKSADWYDLFYPWAMRADEGGVKWPRLDELISQPESYFGERMVSGRDVPRLWRLYQKTKDRRFLRSIIRHNESDLLRSLYLLVHYPDITRRGRFVKPM